MARDCGRSDSAARSLSIIADAEMIEGRHESAQELLREAVQCSKACSDARTEANAVNALGVLAWRRGEFDLAINWFRTALQLREELKEDYDIAAACSNLGLMYYEKGNLIQALELSQRSLEIRERIADHVGAGEVSLNLGLIYCDLGDWEKGLESYFRALAVLEVANDVVSMAVCYSNVGEAYLRRGKLERARANLEKALDLARSSKARSVQADALGILGETSFAAGDIAKALDCYEQNRWICAEIEGVAELAKTLRRLAELDLYQNDPTAARGRLNEALELSRRCGSRKEEGNILRVTGETQALAGDDSNARLSLEQSRAILKELGKNYELGLTLLSLGRLEAKTGEGGKHTLHQALAIFENLGISDMAAKAEKLMGERAAPSAGADLIHELAELVATVSEAEPLCRRALKLFCGHLPATGSTIVLRDGQVYHEGPGAAEPEGPGGTSLALESGGGRIGTLVLRGEVDAAEIRTAVRLLALGIGQCLQRQAGVAVESGRDESRFPDIIGAETTMRAMFDTVEQVAPTRANVLILGESGTGKELVAQAIHRLSGRGDRPLVTVNCAAIPETLLEAELFGIEKGTATGVAGREGKFEVADTGSLFLDEIGDMSPALQAKMLRALQQKTFERVGGRKSIEVDVRVIAATNRDLEKFMADGRFRPDLFYRLSVITLSLPPLRQRLQDLPALISHFVARFAREYGKPVRGASDECMDRLLHWNWPGNVRELVNVLERSVILTRGELVQASDLPAELQTAAPAPTNLREIRSEAKARAFAEAEPAAIVSALQQNNWNVSNAADKLGISRVQLYRIMKKHGLKRPKP